MKVATLGHLNYKNNLKEIPKGYIYNNLIISPEIDFNGIKGHILGLKLSAKQIIEEPLEEVRQRILNASILAQNELNIEIIQLGALTTSVTSAGKWLTKQKEYKGYVNHGDSYTAAITCQTVEKVLRLLGKEKSNLSLSIVGAYGVIGEAVSKLLVPKFKHSILIGRRKNKLEELAKKIDGNFDTTVNLETKKADVVVTATSHPTALLSSHNLKKNAIVIDVSQPPNLSRDVCQKRPDVLRVDGGYVDFPTKQKMPIPSVPPGKLFSCIVEVIMQAAEKHRKNHVGSIDLDYLKKTEEWGKKYDYRLKELTNFGEKLNI
ncbi:MAG: NAD(P)-binding domain-containing protein [Candidatus Thermoplasmatota archaeon]